MNQAETELRAAIEAILFVAGEPISVESLSEAFPDAGRESIEEQLKQIEAAFEERGCGFRLEVAAGGYRFATRPENDVYLRKFFARQNEGRLSLAALETLAIVAYRQPITAPEISEIRGVNSSGVLRTLLERRLIRISGRKNVVGSPFLYRTSREFLVHFGLESIQDLPRLEEFSEVLGESFGDDFAGEAQPAAAEEEEAGTNHSETPAAEDAPADGSVSVAAELRDEAGEGSSAGEPPNEPAAPAPVEDGDDDGEDATLQRSMGSSGDE
jgi:segregation and condensation protein B